LRTEQIEIRQLRAKLRASMWSATSWEKGRHTYRNAEMKHADIDRGRHLWPVRLKCGVRDVRFTGYHQHLQRRQQIMSPLPERGGTAGLPAFRENAE
jgi:hypothetical protein